MEKIKRTDGTYLTAKEVRQFKKDLKKASKPIEDYIKISELEGLLYPTIIGYVEIVKAEKKNDKIIFDLRFGKYMFEMNAEYPISKNYDKEDEIITGRFRTFLEWHVLKNIDEILEHDEEETE